VRPVGEEELRKEELIRPDAGIAPGATSALVRTKLLNLAGDGLEGSFGGGEQEEAATDTVIGGKGLPDGGLGDLLAVHVLPLLDDRADPGRGAEFKDLVRERDRDHVCIEQANLPENKKKNSKKKFKKKIQKKKKKKKKKNKNSYQKPASPSQ